jgi:ATP-dependent Clp protease protease subunit
MNLNRNAIGIYADANPGFRVQLKGSTAAEIYIYSDIGESWWGDGVTAKKIADELKALGGDVTEITVHINSYGGDVFDGLAIYRQLVDHKAKVTTHVDGIAASAASVVAMAGDTIHVANGGQIMIHDAWTIGMGNAEELRATADRVDMTSQELAKLYAARTKRTETEVRDWMRAETWMTAQEAVDRGFADKVVDFQRAAARAVPGFVNYIREFDGIAAEKRPFRNLPEPPRSERMRSYADGIASMEGRMADARRKRTSGRG